MPEKRRPPARTSKPITGSNPPKTRSKPRPPEPQPEPDYTGFITSPDNDKAKFVRLLQNKRDRYASRHFLIEGVRLVKEALKAETLPTYTLFEPEALRKTESGRGLLLRLNELMEEKKGVFPVIDKIIASVSDTVTPQGVAAAMPFLSWPDEKFAEKRLHIILDGLQDPGNLGTILRSAWGAGNAAVWLLENSVDLYSPKVVRAGMGSHFYVPARLDQKWPDLLKNLKKLGVKQIFLAEGEVTETGEGRASYRRLPSVNYYEVNWNEPVAVIIGNEAHGASREGWQAASNLVHVPMPGGAESLNAAIAASLIIFEALRQQTHQ
jgi:TrmH family RNA methyltransferase